MIRTLLCLFAAAAVCAAEPDKDGFVPLFNGRDLSGWLNVNCAPETWTFKDGVVHCTGFPTGSMRTERQYENFILELEWRHLRSGGNSGVFLWGSPVAAPGVPFLRGIEVQVLENGYPASGKNEWYTTHGDVFPIHGATMKPFGRSRGMRSFPSEERSKPSPEWNHYRITATNGVIHLEVNGKEVSGGSDCNYRKGYLALESEGAPVEFRNVRIKELPSSNTPPELSAPLDEGFRSIFTGLDLRAWRTNTAPVAAWSVAGERLRCNVTLEPARDPSHDHHDFGPQKGVLWTSNTFTGIVEFVMDVRPRGTNENAGAVFLSPQPIPLTLDPQKKDAWQRFHLKRENDLVKVTRDGIELLTIRGIQTGPTPIGILGAAADYMNLYVKEAPARK